MTPICCEATASPPGAKPHEPRANGHLRLLKHTLG
jgi:hypothetical protein